VNKSASALIGAGLLWTIYALFGRDQHLVSENLTESVAATAQIVFFLMGAMTIIEVVDAHNDWKRVFFLLLGVVVFCAIYYAPPWPDAIDPMGKHFTLSPEGKGALALFALAATWWIFEVLPIGVTGIAIGVIQALFLIRKPDVTFKDFMDPSVLFILGSIVIGLVFTKSGLTKRMAYKMLSIVGERTSMIYLGCFVMTVALTHLMAHTAVAATMFPLLMAINALYSDEDKPT